MPTHTTFITHLPARFAALAEALDTLAAETVSSIAIPVERLDPTFGSFGLLAGFVRAAANIEGQVLEEGLRLALIHDGGFILKPAGFRLPLVEAAIETVRANDADTLKSIRLGSRAFAVEHYTPDLVAVSRKTQTAFILELKRATASYGGKQLSALEQKMTAAALVVGDVLHADRSPALVSRVEIAVIDCSDNDGRNAVIGLSALDAFLGCEGIGACLSYLRHRYAHHVQAALAALTNHNPACAVGRSIAAASAHDDDQDDREDEAPGVLVRFARKRQVFGQGARS